MEASSSAINAQHPDGPPAEEDDFFGGAGEPAPEPTLPAEQAAPEAEVEAQAEVQAAPEEPAAAAEPEPALVKDEREPAAQSPGSPAMIAEEKERQAAAEAAAASAAPQEDPPAAAASGGSNRSGAAEREYVVLHHVPLTERALQFFLKEIGEGREVRTALLELTRVEARNVKQAAGAAFLAHKERLGDTAKLAIVPAKSFQVKTIAPKQKPVETTLDIS